MMRGASTPTLRRLSTTSWVACAVIGAVTGCLVSIVTHTHTIATALASSAALPVFVWLWLGIGRAWRVMVLLVGILLAAAAKDPILYGGVPPRTGETVESVMRRWGKPYFDSRQEGDPPSSYYLYFEGVRWDMYIVETRDGTVTRVRRKTR